MQFGHHDLGCGDLFAIKIHWLDGYAAAVIDYGDRIINMNRALNFVGMPSEGFVNRVVDDFIDQMMQSELASGANVQSRTLPDSFHPAENLHGIGVVVTIAASGGSGVRVPSILVFFIYDFCLVYIVGSLSTLGE